MRTILMIIGDRFGGRVAGLYLAPASGLGL